MHLQQLKIFQYRNFSAASCCFSPGMNYLVGSNAQGKTNLIEAINFLSIARSFRTTKKAELIKWGHDEASVIGMVAQSLGSVSLGAIFQKGKNKFLVNDNSVSSASDFVGRFVVVSFFPDDLDLVKSGPSSRRKLIDRHIVDLDPTKLFFFMRFNQALRNKSELLKASGIDKFQLEAWNHLLAENSIEVAKSRLDFIDALNPLFRVVHFETTRSEDTPTLTLKSDLIHSSGEVFSSTEAIEAYQQASAREIASKRTLFGTQRDEIDILIGERSARSFASQGQSRSLVLSLKIAIATLIEQRLGDSPLLLLDDVDSELDLSRSEGLFSKLLGTNRQIIMTGTDSAWRRFPFQNEVNIQKVHKGQLCEC